MEGDIEGNDLLKGRSFEYSEQEYQAFQEQAQTSPLRLATNDRQTFWWYKDDIYATEDEALTAQDVMALALESENKRRLKLEKAHALMAMTQQLDTKAKRQPIPHEVKVAVWQRDGGRCVECGSQQELEYDHIIPVAVGGSNTDRNLQLLCADCNRRKGASLG